MKMHQLISASYQANSPSRSHQCWHRIYQARWCQEDWGCSQHVLVFSPEERSFKLLIQPNLVVWGTSYHQEEWDEDGCSTWLMATSEIHIQKLTMEGQFLQQGNIDVQQHVWIPMNLQQAKLLSRLFCQHE